MGAAKLHKGLGAENIGETCLPSFIMVALGLAQSGRFLLTFLSHFQYNQKLKTHLILVFLKVNLEKVK